MPKNALIVVRGNQNCGAAVRKLKNELKHKAKRGLDSDRQFLSRFDTFNPFLLLTGLFYCSYKVTDGEMCPLIKLFPHYYSIR